MTSTNNPQAIRNAIAEALEDTDDYTMSRFANMADLKAARIDRILSAIAPLLASTPPVSTSTEKCIGMTPGWVPTYNDPDNAGLKREAEPIFAKDAEPFVKELREMTAGFVSVEMAQALYARHFNGQGEDSK